VKRASDVISPGTRPTTGVDLRHVEKWKSAIESNARIFWDAKCAVMSKTMTQVRHRIGAGNDFPTVGVGIQRDGAWRQGDGVSGNRRERRFG
jgi:hypothetical protein